MFSKISRYRKLPDIVTTDADGKARTSRTLRLLPEVSGEFRHIVEEIDQLDHLAFKYYKQSRKWWRICDANPDFLSPLDLLGKGSLVTSRFTLLGSEASKYFPWARLFTAMANEIEIGLESFRPIEQLRLMEQASAPGDGEGVVTEAWGRALDVTYNRLNVAESIIRDKLEQLINQRVEGPVEVHSQEISRLGKQIVIPPDTLG